MDPLKGIRVVDATAGPMRRIGGTLAMLGATVTGAIPEGGDGADPLEACKSHVSCEELAALIDHADILLDDGSVLDRETVKDVNPRLVTLAISDFGDGGPLQEWRGSEAVFHALSAGLSRSGLPGREPLLPPPGLAYGVAVAHGAFVALLGYVARKRSGSGARIDFSIVDAVSQALDPGFGIAGTATDGVPASSMPRGRAEARFRYPIIPCKDGFVRLCVLAPRQWRALYAWMGSPPAFADSAFDKIETRFASTALIPAVARLFAPLTCDEIEREAQRRGVPAAAVARANAEPVERSLSLSNGPKLPFPISIDSRSPADPSFTGDVVVKRQSAAPATRMAEEFSGRPLAGLRVLDLGVIVVGAESGRLLADYGADVIKIESRAFPDGSRQSRHPGPMSPSFAAGHRNKRSLGLDLRHPSGKAIFLKLVAQSDVVLSNFKHGTLEALRLGQEELRRANPRVVLVESSAFGPEGQGSGRMGYGPLVRAASGLTDAWRYPGDAVAFADSITVYPDHAAARLGLIAALALLVRRDRTGAGGHAAISQLDVIHHHLSAPMPATTSHVLPALGDDEWCAVTAVDEHAEAISRLTGGHALSEWVAQRSPMEAAQALQARGIAAAPMLRVAELPAFPHYRARHSFRTVSHPFLDMPIVVDDGAVSASGIGPPPQRPAPLPGEHSRVCLREVLGLSDQAIDALIADGVVEQVGELPNVRKGSAR